MYQDVMSGMTDLVFLFLFLSFASVSCQDPSIHVQTEAGKTFDALCPAKHYVSSVTIVRESTVGNQTDFRFSVQCQPFVGGVMSEVGEETCTVLLPIPMLYDDLSFDDYEYNCDCNEYLAGIRSEHFGQAWDGPMRGPERRIQLICCRAKGVRINNGVCGYTGMESLIGAPWRESQIGSAGVKKAAIQGLILSNNYVNSRVCVIESVPLTDLGIGDCYEYGDCASTGGNQLGPASGNTRVNNVRSQRAATGNLSPDAQLCYNHQNEPFGWTENLGYISGETEASHRSSQWYNKQEFVCRNGHRITSVSMNKRKADSNHTDIDYVLSAKCSSSDRVSACYCYWMNSCPSDKEGLVGVWYVGGIRSWFDGHRKMELLCCLSSGIKTTTCSPESVSDSKSTFSQHMDLDAGTSVGFIRNIETAYSGNTMSMQITTCGGVLTGDWCSDDYDAQCRRCRRRTRQSQYQRQLPDANGGASDQNANGNGNTNGNGNGAANAYRYTTRGSSGWGPLWYARPVYTYTVVTNSGGSSSSSGRNSGSSGSSGSTGGGSSGSNHNHGRGSNSGGGGGDHHHEGGSSGGSHSGGGGHHTVPAPPACSFTPSTVQLPVHGHGGHGNSPTQSSYGLSGPPLRSHVSSVHGGSNIHGGKSGSAAGHGSRSINEYHSGQGRGGNPVGPSASAAHAARVAGSAGRPAATVGHVAPGAVHAVHMAPVHVSPVHISPVHVSFHGK